MSSSHTVAITAPIGVACAGSGIGVCAACAAGVVIIGGVACVAGLAVLQGATLLAEKAIDMTIEAAVKYQQFYEENKHIIEIDKDRFLESQEKLDLHTKNLTQLLKLNKLNKTMEKLTTSSSYTPPKNTFDTSQRKSEKLKNLLSDFRKMDQFIITEQVTNLIQSSKKALEQTGFKNIEVIKDKNLLIKGKKNEITFCTRIDKNLKIETDIAGMNGPACLDIAKEIVIKISEISNIPLEICNTNYHNKIDGGDLIMETKTYLNKNEKKEVFSQIIKNVIPDSLVKIKKSKIMDKTKN